MGDLPARTDLFDVFRRSVVTANAPRINPKVVDIPGSDINLFGNGVALVGEELSRAFQQCIRNLFASTARGDGLDRIVMDRTGGLLPRKDASPSTADLQISRPTPAAGAGIVPAGTRVTSAAGVQFATDVDVAFGALDVTASVAATCTQTGPVGRVPAVSLTAFVDQPYDASMTASNPAGAAGGTDEEDDVRYAARYFGFFVTIRRGVLGAIQHAALLVAGVEVASAIEVLNGDGTLMPAAAVQLIVGDSDGNSSGPMLQATKDVLLEWRAGGIPVFVTGGVPAFEPVRWSGLQYLTGIDTVAAQNAVRAVTVAVSQFLNPGDTLYRSSLISGAKAVPGVIVPDNALVAPAGDVVAVTPQTITRTRPDLVTFV